jgi:hypothetical protein
MIKLTNLLKEITEAKQVGDLYHFTPLSNLKKILETRFLYSNDEKVVSTSIRPNMVTHDLPSMDKSSIVRIMLDGNKISNKYKIRPFAYNSGDSSDGWEDLGEEQIITNGEKFYFIPYLKRIDIFLNKKEIVNPKILELLEKTNIPYKIYQGTPLSNIPYSQPKDGNPEDINIDAIPEKKIYTKEELYYPGMKYAKTIEYWMDKEDVGKDYPNEMKVYTSPEYPGYYIFAGLKKSDNEWGNWDKYEDYYSLKGEKLVDKVVPMPMYNDPKWRKMWDREESALTPGSVSPSKAGNFEIRIKDSYCLISKSKVD